jgi:DNA primase
LSRVDPSFIQRVKDGVNIVEVVGQHVLLKKTGANYVGLCPFHQERSPSFSVSEAKQLFHCYGCKKGGDVVKFVMELHGSSFSDTVEELAERANLPLPKTFVSDDSLSPAEQDALKLKREKLQLQYKLNRYVAKFYHDHLNADARTVEYLRRRGVDEEMQKLFYLGSTPSGWSPLSKKLIDAKAPLDLAKEMGLIRESTKAQPGGIPSFDLFRDRVMFPILDVKGKVVGFGGRTLSVNPDGPKYLNSSESPIFQKSKTLYGLFHSQKSIRAEDSVIVVEGYFDFLALYRAGFQNVVATCGTALTQDHLKTLRRFASKIILLFDSDSAGEQATLKSMELGLSLGMVLYSSELPAKKDVDEVLFGSGDAATGALIESGRLHVETLLKNAKAILDREIERCIRSANESVEKKSLAAKQIGEWLRQFQDPIGREVRIEKVCRDLGVSRGVIDPNLKSGGGPIQSAQRPFGSPQNGGAGPFRPISSLPAAPSGQMAFLRPPNSGVAANRASFGVSGLDKTLLKGILQGGQFLEMIREAEAHLPEGWKLEELVQQSDIRVLFTRVLGGENPQSDWESEIQESGVRTLFREGLLRAEKTAETEPGDEFNLKDFQVVVRKALQKVWARFSQRLLPELTVQGDLSRSQEWLDVQNKIKELGNFYDQNE